MAVIIVHMAQNVFIQEIGTETASLMASVEYKGQVAAQERIFR